MTKEELVFTLRSDLFNSCESIGEAYEFALSMAESGSISPAGLCTALHMMMNAIAKEVENLEV